jgi:hypothetical protein
MEKLTLKFRTWHKGLPPQKIRAEIPGWAGDHKDHRDGCTPQPWHCIPFMEGSLYGLELIYPFDSECHVINKDGKIMFEGDFSNESTPWENEHQPKGSPPFLSFAAGHYGFTSSLDLEPPEGYSIRLETHQRYYTDSTGTVPLAVPGHIQRWWSKIFFVVFKSPWPGQTHIFKKGEPYAKILIVPNKLDYDVTPFSTEEVIERRIRDELVNKNNDKIKKASFKSDAGYNFDDKYKQLLKMYAKGGYQNLDSTLKEMGRDKPKKAKYIGKFVKKRENVQVGEIKTK